MNALPHVVVSHNVLLALRFNPHPTPFPQTPPAVRRPDSRTAGGLSRDREARGRSPPSTAFVFCIRFWGGGGIPRSFQKPKFPKWFEPAVACLFWVAQVDVRAGADVWTAV